MSQAKKDEEEKYAIKLQILTRKCNEVKQETDRVYERLLHSKRLLGKLVYERK